MDELKVEEIDLQELFGTEFPISAAEVERYPNGTIKYIKMVLWDGSVWDCWSH